MVQDLNYNQNEGPVYQDWGPSLETDQGRGFLDAGLCSAHDGSFVLTREDKAKQRQCLMDYADARQAYLAQAALNIESYAPEAQLFHKNKLILFIFFKKTVF